MGFRDMNIWKHGLFKGISMLFSSPKHAAMCIYSGEDGVVSKYPLPLDTGFVTVEAIKNTWLAIQALKVRMQGVSEQVMVITPRSYIPVNPLRKLTSKEKDDLTPLDNIADVKYNEAFTRVSEENQKNQNHQMLRTMMYLMFVLTGIVFLIVLVKG